MKESQQTGKLAGVMAMLVLLAACGGGGGSDSQGAAQPPGAPPPSAPVLTTAPTPSYADALRMAAFNAVNAERLKASLGALRQSTVLDTAAGYHSNYLLLNPTSTPTYSEDEGMPGYVADTPYARRTDAGYDVELGNGGELLTANVSVGTDAALLMLAGPYHRAYLMGQSWTQMGWGFVPDADGVGTLIGEVGLPRADTAQGMTGSSSVYPISNAADVPVMMANEQPAYPLPVAWGSNGYPGYPGYPVSVQLPMDDIWTPGTFSLVETSSGAAVAGVVLDSTSAALTNFGIKTWAFFIPSAPLKPSTSYTATFTATVDTHAFSKTWSFVTRGGTVTFTNVPRAAVAAAAGATLNVKSASLMQTVANVTLSSQCGGATPHTVVSPGSIKLSLSGAVASGCAATVVVDDLAYPSESNSLTVNFVP